MNRIRVELLDAWDFVWDNAFEFLIELLLVIGVTLAGVILIGMAHSYDRIIPPLGWKSIFPLLTFYRFIRLTDWWLENA